MIKVKHTQLKYKFWSVYISKKEIWFRLLTPTLLRGEAMVLDNFLKPKKQLNKYVFHQNTYYLVSHELKFKLSSKLWKKNNTLVIYTDPELFLNNLVRIDKKSKVNSLKTVFIEFTCNHNNQLFTETDFIYYYDKNGKIVSNLK